MRYSLVRYNLDRCYSYQEYKKAIAHAEENINVGGMKEQIKELKQEAQIYRKSIEEIVNPVRESENRKYLEWEMWYKAKELCKKIMLGLVGCTIVCWILGMIIGTGFTLLGMLGIILCFIMLLALIVTKVTESIYAAAYNKYINKVKAKITERNAIFEYDVHRCYEAIDQLYLQSLDPTHREMVLMRREQAEHNKEIKRLEMERQMKQNELLQEQKKARKAQERLLEIEEERERRRGYR